MIIIIIIQWNVYRHDPRDHDVYVCLSSVLEKKKESYELYKNLFEPFVPNIVHF